MRAPAREPQRIDRFEHRSESASRRRATELRRAFLRRAKTEVQPLVVSAYVTAGGRREGASVR